MIFSGWPWWGQLIGLVVSVIVLVYLFQNIILPLLNKIT